MRIDHPYAEISPDEKWLRGNLHTHTTRSDGTRDPQEVISDYARRGYDFLMISDHDIWTSGADYSQWNDEGLTFILGNEITRDGVHILHVDADRKVEPWSQRQRAIQEIAESRGFAVVCHPNWQERFNHCPIERLEEWIGYAGVEIFNGAIGRLAGSPYATDKWDILLSSGRSVWGFANDDTHRAEDVGLGWNMVLAPDRTPQRIVSALRAGRFYPSTGVVIRHIAVEGTRIRIETENASRIVALTRHGTRFQVADDRAIEVQVKENMSYVRFECWGDGEAFAWTQPFIVRTE